MLISKAVLGLLLVCVLSGCAYHASFADRQIPGGYRTVAVPVFKNSSHEAGVEVYFTNAFVRELERARTGRVTPKTNSQVIVEGTIESVDFVIVEQVEGRTLQLPSNTVLNKQYRIAVAATLRLRRNSDQKVLWEGQFRKEQSYQTPRIGRVGDATVGYSEDLTSANALYNHSARYQNIQLIAADMMAEAHDRMTENF